jgi:hypothetical protein
MRQFVIALIALAVSAAAVNVGQAGEPHRRRDRDRRDDFRVERRVFDRDYRPYYVEFGRRFSGGWYFEGRNDDHFAYRMWDDGRGRYHYYDSDLRSFFFWHEGHGRYYPIDFIVE